MFLGIDVGGTKTLLAVFDENGQILKQFKFSTPEKYEDFLKALKNGLDRAQDYKIKACCCAVPGKVDRKNGVGVVYGNLTWHDSPIKDDISRLLGGIDVAVENDANLAGLYEASLYHRQYKKVLYLTIGTGIGDAEIIDGMIDPSFADSEAGQTLLDHEGELVRWEDLASGRALKRRYGKKASEINDPKIWQEYTQDLALGLIELIAVMQPDVIIVGGGVGTHFNKYGELLRAELKRHEAPMVPIPPVIQATKPEEAVIYGCYEYIRQKLGAQV